MTLCGGKHGKERTLSDVSVEAQDGILQGFFSGNAAYSGSNKKAGFGCRNRLRVRGSWVYQQVKKRIPDSTLGSGRTFSCCCCSASSSGSLQQHACGIQTKSIQSQPEDMLRFPGQACRSLLYKLFEVLMLACIVLQNVLQYHIALHDLLEVLCGQAAGKP